jgi:hypothetical protein
VLYVSIDGRLAARFYINYRPDKDFVKAVNMLGDMGVAVGVRSHNPAINSDTIAARCPMLRYKVYAIKTGSGEEDDLSSKRETTESGICANRKAACLSIPFIAARRIKKIYEVDKKLRIVAAAAGGLFVILMWLFGMIHEFNSVWAAIYQLAWMIPTAILSLAWLCGRK